MTKRALRNLARRGILALNRRMLKPLGMELVPLRGSGARAYQAAPETSGDVAAESAFAGLSETVNPRRYDLPVWRALHDELAGYSTDGHVFFTEAGHVYRKGWEWTHCLYGLDRLGAIQPSARALGVGAGREPVIFYLADRVAQVTATDLYGDATWSNNAGQEASRAILDDAQAFCPRPIRRDRIAFKVADGTQLPFLDGAFEIVWSLSSIEHFGGHAAAADAMREMGRVTAPGGHVALATEYLLLPEYRHPEFFNRTDVEDALIAPAREVGLHLVDTPDFDAVPRPYLIDSVPLPQDQHRRRRHVVLNDGDVQWTSILLFFRKQV